MVEITYYCGKLQCTRPVVYNRGKRRWEHVQNTDPHVDTSDFHVAVPPATDRL